MGLDLEVSFQSALTDGRRNLGLQPARLGPVLAPSEGSRSSRDRHGWKSIREHPFFSDLAENLGVSLDEAFLAYTRVAAETLDEASKLIVDRVLALGLENRTYETFLGERRRALFPAWQSLLAKAGRTEDAYFSESFLRLTAEEQALNDLAARMDRPTAALIAALPLSDATALQLYLEDPRAIQVGGEPRVVVFGAAVMDIIFRISSVPEADTSVQASVFEMHPGGKGLTQAVAAARLGMKVSLVAAVGDDTLGTTIIKYLKSENVDTSLIKVVKGETSPVTGVITPDTGISFALGWKNEERVSISERDLKQTATQKALTTCECLLVTFEPPIDAVENAIDIVHAKGIPVILTPAPPSDRRVLDPKVQSQVDYLVSNVWEAQKFSRIRDDDGGVGVRPDFAEAAKRLLFARIKHVLVTFDGQCHAFYRSTTGQQEEFQVPAWPTNIHESAGARDAFCAMLALHLTQNGGKFTKRAVHWATAAMSYAGGMLGVPDSMPTLEQVEEIVQTGAIAIPDD